MTREHLDRRFAEFESKFAEFESRIIRWVVGIVSASTLAVLGMLFTILMRLPK